MWPVRVTLDSVTSVGGAGRDDRPHVAEDGDVVGGRVGDVDGVRVAVDREAGRAEKLAAAEGVGRVAGRSRRVAVCAVVIDARRVIS